MKMKENIIKSKSFLFAINSIKLCQEITKNKSEFVMTKQLLRSGTSVGALIREAEFAESKADFKHKLCIARKEINESIYWLELLFETEYLSKEKFNQRLIEAKEILHILTKIIKTLNINLKSQV